MKEQCCINCQHYLPHYALADGELLGFTLGIAGITPLKLYDQIVQPVSTSLKENHPKISLSGRNTFVKGF